MNSISLDELLPDLPPEITLVPFMPAHALVMRITDRNALVMQESVSLEKMMHIQAASGHAITALLNGTPAACFGSVHVWKGVEEMWCLLEERSRKYALSLTKIAKGYSDFRVIAGNLHRLQIAVRSDDLRAVRWGEAIGFKTEGRMRKYGPDGSDFFLMSRV